MADSLWCLPGDETRFGCIPGPQSKPSLSAAFPFSFLPYSMLSGHKSSWFTANTPQERHQCILTLDYFLPGVGWGFLHLSSLAGWIVTESKKQRSVQGHTCNAQWNQDENQVSLAPRSVCSPPPSSAPPLYFGVSWRDHLSNQQLATDLLSWHSQDWLI